MKTEINIIIEDTIMYISEKNTDKLILSLDNDSLETMIEEIGENVKHYLHGFGSNEIEKPESEGIEIPLF